MYQNFNYTQQLLANIQYELNDIDHLQPGDFIKHLLCQQISGIEPTILRLMYEAIHQYQSERAIIKYIKIIDKLIKYPNFIPAINNSIVQIYSDLFMFLLIQKCNKQIEQIKILRKYWVGPIHPLVLHQMKQNILHKYRIDIDSGFKPDTIATIKQYYQNKLKMNPQALNQHLPYVGNNLQMAKNYQNFNNYAAFSNQNNFYNVEKPQNPIRFIPNQNYPFQYNQGVNTNHYNPPVTHMPSGYQQYRPNLTFRPQNPVSNPYINARNTMNIQEYPDRNQYQGPFNFQNQQRRNIDQQNFDYRPNNVSNSFNNSYQTQQNSYDLATNKRKRMASQQTRGAVTPMIISSLKEESTQGNTILEEKVEPKPRKIIHSEEPLNNHLMLLQKLKKLNPFSCKQCGIQFISQQNLSIHKNQHLKQKLNLNQKLCKPVRSSQLLSEKEWVCDKQQKHFQYDQFCVVAHQQYIGQILCNFCCSQFNLQFRNNKWVYSNATHVQIDNEILIMHKSCQMVLQEPEIQVEK